MNDWYDRGKNKIFQQIAARLGCEMIEIETFYHMFSEYGLAGDYDVEKEVFWDAIHGEENV